MCLARFNKIIHLFFQETRPSYRSQLRDTKLSSYQSRVRPSSRNFDDDKPKHNDVDSYLSRRNNTTGRTTTFSDRDKVGSSFLGHDGDGFVMVVLVMIK